MQSARRRRAPAGGSGNDLVGGCILGHEFGPGGRRAFALGAVRSDGHSLLFPGVIIGVPGRRMRGWFGLRFRLWKTEE